METIILTPHKAYLKQAQQFIEQYNIVDASMPIKSNLKELKPKQERKCRFCGRSYPNARFKKVAHLIPDLLGNKYLFSDFECDDCNHYFGITLENDLSNYLGIHRTLTRTKGKEGIPTFTAPGKTLKAKSHHILNDDTIIISREDCTNGVIRVDAAKGETRIRFKKNAFSPLNVYKSILKVALSIIQDEEVTRDYQLAINFLMGRTKGRFTGCLMSGYMLPFNFSFPPHLFLFKKRNANAKIHTHVLALYFQNMIFALPVPLNKNDLFFYNQKDVISLNLYPPLFTQYTNTQNMILQSFVDDFSSGEKIKGLEEEIILQFSSEDLAHAAAFDLKTNQIHKTKFNPSEIVQIIIRRNDLSIDPLVLGKAIQSNTKF